MRKNLFVLFLLISFVVPQSAFALGGNDNEKSVKISRAEREMAESIKADRLRDFLTFISSDAMGGRNTPSPGLDITADFLAFNLKSWGFKPAGDDGTFFQRMWLKSKVRKSVSMSIGDMKMDFGPDYLPLSGTEINATDVVFVGDGWMVKSKGINPYEGIDVKDKVVVIYSSKGGQSISGGAPEGVTKDDMKDAEKGVTWADPATYAEKNGAAGIIAIANPLIQQRWGGYQRFLTRSRSSVEGLGAARGINAPNVPTILMNQDAAKKMFAGGEGDMNTPKSFSLGKPLKFVDKVVEEKVPTQNVVAIWEGSDSKLKDEMVAIGAHYDHVGTNENARGEDKIYNGADDDGSGTVGVLAIAEALAKAKKRPKRSILFVWHAGEEKGLWGSEFFNKYPTVDIKKVVAQLNIDMIGRSKKAGDENPRNKDLSGPNEVYVIGSEMMSSTLGRVTKQANDSYKKLNYNYKYDDPNDTNRFFFRSDHFNYAVNGIPIVFWFTGVHEDYHQPGDEVHKIDFAKLETITRTIFLTMWEISELKERPAVDKELPPELKNR